jgi:hypothetical protein
MDDVATTKPGAARRWLATSYAGYRPEQSDSHRDFNLCSRHVRVGSGSLARLRYSLSADNNVVLSDVLVVVQPVDGGMKAGLGRRWFSRPRPRLSAPLDAARNRCRTTAPANC